MSYIRRGNQIVEAHICKSFRKDLQFFLGSSLRCDSWYGSQVHVRNQVTLVILHCAHFRSEIQHNQMIFGKEKVSCQKSFFGKWLWALSTFKSPLPTVSFKVPLHMSSPAKWFWALSTFKTLLSTVSFKVALQISNQAKWFVAFCTFVNLFTTVC